MPKQTMSRRQALKIIAAAATGVGAAAFLPGKWVKPLVQTGVLPAHAQSSDPYVINASRGVSGIQVYAFYGVTMEPGGGKMAAPAATVGLPAVGKLITMSVLSVTGGTAGNYVPTLPRNATTGVNGIAIFGSQTYDWLSGEPTVTFLFTAANGATDTLVDISA